MKTEKERESDNHLEESDTRMTSVSNSSSQVPLSEGSEPPKRVALIVDPVPVHVPV